MKIKLLPILLLALMAVVFACAPAPQAEPGGASGESPAPPEVAAAAPVAEWALAIHGGAGVRRAFVPEESEGEYLASLETALELGRSMLDSGASSLDTVEAVVRLMEDDPLFNAGRGSVFTNAGTNEMDAAIMDGSTLDCGAVSGITTVKNPISLARGVMEKSRHVFMMGEGAERFADEVEAERVEPEYFFVQKRYDQWQRALEKEKAGEGGKGGYKDATASLSSMSEEKHGTVGAVALDRNGNLAAATSTGGMTNKRFGRVGDVPVIGAGTYANNATCAISGTGVGEQFIRHTVTGDISGRMEHGGASLAEAADAVIHGRLKPNDGGVIAVDKHGGIVMSFNSEGMFRGATDSNGRFEVAIWSDGD